MNSNICDNCRHCGKSADIEPCYSCYEDDNESSFEAEVLPSAYRQQGLGVGVVDKPTRLRP